MGKTTARRGYMSRNTSNSNIITKIPISSKQTIDDTIEEPPSKQELEIQEVLSNDTMKARLGAEGIVKLENRLKELTSARQRRDRVTVGNTKPEVKKLAKNATSNKKHNTIILDVETTGSRDGNFMVEVGYFVCDKFMNIIERDRILIKYNPIKIDYFNKLSKEEIMICGIDPKELIPMMNNIFSKCQTVVAHYFEGAEKKWFEEHASRYNQNINWPRKVFCTMVRSKHIVNAKDKRNRLKNPKLEELANYYNVDYNDSHTALGDVKITYECYCAMIKKPSRYTKKEITPEVTNKLLGFNIPRIKWKEKTQFGTIIHHHTTEEKNEYERRKESQRKIELKNEEIRPLILKIIPDIRKELDIQNEEIRVSLSRPYPNTNLMNISSITWSNNNIPHKHIDYVLNLGTCRPIRSSENQQRLSRNLLDKILDITRDFVDME